jgi:hypothetical protein
VKRIGNLTLLKSDENLAAGNKPFSTKKNAFKRSQLKLNEGLATENSWAPDRIAARQSMLAKIAVQTWPLKP